MLNVKRRLVLLLIGLSGLALAYLDPTRCVHGWLRGEAFYDGRPTSYWAAEIQKWEFEIAVCNCLDSWTEGFSRRSPWPPWLERIFPMPRAEWPRLLDGDAAGLLVLQELCGDPDGEVRDWARIGLERIQNDERGPHKIHTGLDEFVRRIGNPARIGERPCLRL
jgi:hypothetical protein